MINSKKRKIKWTSKIAYAVGLIATDGCLSSDKRHIDLTSKDIQLLNIFKECLELDNKIGSKQSSYSNKRNYFRVQFGDVVFYKWLLDIGLTPNKSKTIGSLKIPDKYFFDFLRGHLDGDGCIRKFQDSVYHNSQRIYTSFYSASIPHVKWLQNKIKKLLNINGCIQTSTRTFVLRYAKKESLALLAKIYSNKKVPYFERKYRIIQNLI